jgi:hypothetical protein
MDSAYTKEKNIGSKSGGSRIEKFIMRDKNSKKRQNKEIKRRIYSF